MLVLAIAVLGAFLVRPALYLGGPEVLRARRTKERWVAHKAEARTTHGTYEFRRCRARYVPALAVLGAAALGSLWAPPDADTVAGAWAVGSVLGAAATVTFAYPVSHWLGSACRAGLAVLSGAGLGMLLFIAVGKLWAVPVGAAAALVFRVPVIARAEHEKDKVPWPEKLTVAPLLALREVLDGIALGAATYVIVRSADTIDKSTGATTPEAFDLNLSDIAVLGGLLAVVLIALSDLAQVRTTDAAATLAEKHAAQTQRASTT